MKKIKSVTICVPAHNEAANIANFLDSLLRQSAKNYKILKIFVLCDGCTDDTAKIARSYSRKNSLIRVKEFRLSKGKVFRINQMFSDNTSDILGLFDADIVLSGNKVIEDIIKMFSDPKVGLVGGNDKPARPTNILQKVASVWIDVWNESRYAIKHGNNALSCHGQILFLSKDLAKLTHIPNIISDDVYLYFFAKSQGFKFRLALNSVIYYRIPATLRDYMVQAQRYSAMMPLVVPYFGKVVVKEYSIPLHIKIRALWIVFKKDLVLFPFVFVFQSIFQLIVKTSSPKFIGSKWETVTSTKDKAISI